MQTMFLGKKNIKIALHKPCIGDEAPSGDQASRSYNQQIDRKTIEILDLFKSILANNLVLPSYLV